MSRGSTGQAGDVNASRGWTVEPSRGEPIQFVIGMRWTQLWRLAAQPWVPIAFGRMLRAGEPDGLLRTRFAVRRKGPVVVQRWSNREAVDRWARATPAAHQAPWARFAREVPGGTTAWGIWHEVGALSDEFRPGRPASAACPPPSRPATSSASAA